MNLKKLMEQRASLKAELDGILEAVKGEQRAMTDEENTKFEDLEKQIKALDKTIAAEKRARDLDLGDEPAPAEQRTVEEQEAAEVRAFDAYLRDLVEQRTDPTDVNMTKGRGHLPAVWHGDPLQRGRHAHDPEIRRRLRLHDHRGLRE